MFRAYRCHPFISSKRQALHGSGDSSGVSNLTRFTDANNNATNYAYDSLIRFTSSTDALNGNTNLTYNPLDDVTGVKDQRNNTTTYTYNAFGDVVGEVSPDRGTIAYVVDKAGNVTKRTDARGVVTDYTWDALNRLTAVEYPSDSSLDTTLTYDLTTGCGTAGIGRLCSVADASGTTTYEYDNLGHLTEVSEARTSGPTLTTGYTYDLAGNVLTITLPSGRVVTYSRNANGLVSGVSGIVNAGSVQFASSVTYAPFGPVTGMAYGNSLTFSATYDQDYNPTNRTVSTIYNNTYDTDDQGNITQTGSTTYGYDALNRLNSESPGSATTYTYDATSNRLTKVAGGTTTTTVPATSNKISAVGGSSITYDSSGNYTASGTNGYTWNAASQLATASVSGTPAGTYTYNASNQRTKKVAGGNTVQYVYGLNGLLYGEYTTAGALIREYVYLNDEPLAQIDAGTPDVLTYLHPDHLGTPKFATNTGGSQVWAANADAFGVGIPSGSRTVNLRMPGQYYDSESGLFYNWNRYYSPVIGRYISSDPIGQEGGLNTFNYAESNPVMFVDPEGLRTLFNRDGGPVFGMFGSGSATEASSQSNKAAQTKTTGQCFNMCMSEFLDDVNPVQGVVVAGATPIPKKSVGLPRLGNASKYTNPISLAGRLFENEPRMSSRVLGTARVCGALGRANVYVAGALGVYDSSAVLTCTLLCATE